MAFKRYTAVKMNDTCHVRVTGDTMAISKTLASMFPSDMKHVMVDYDPKRSLMRLTPAQASDPGRLVICRCRGQMKVAASGFLAHWGLNDRVQRVNIVASMVDGAAEFQIPPERPSDERRGAGDGKMEETGDRIDPIDRVDPIVAKPGPEPKAAPVRAVDDRPDRCCRNCAWQRLRQCQNQDSPYRNKLVSLSGCCDGHFYNLSLRKPGEADPRPTLPACTVNMDKVHTPPQRAKWNGDAKSKASKSRVHTSPHACGSRPRIPCPVSDHGGRTFAVSLKGIMPHDVDGVVYSAGRGDRTRLCPGSNRKPQG